MPRLARELVAGGVALAIGCALPRSGPAPATRVADVNVAQIASATRVAPAVSRPPPPTDPDLSPVDRTVDACDDFARYACGPVDPGAQPGPGPSDAIVQRGAALERFMAGLAAGPPIDASPGEGWLRDFYRRCLDRSAREAGLPQLRGELDQLAQAPTLAALAHQLGRLRAEGTKLLVDLTPERSIGHATGAVAGRVGLAPLRSPGRRDAAPRRPIGDYLRHWQRLAQLSGVVSPDEATVAARIDERLAARWRTPVDPPPAPAGPLTREALRQARFPWLDYLSGLPVAVTGPFVTRAPGDLALVDALVDLPLSDLKSYARVTLLERWAERLDEAFLAEEIAFHQGTEQAHATGRAPTDAPTLAATRDGPRACTRLAARDLNPLLAHAYLWQLSQQGGASSARPLLARQLFDRLRARLDRRVRRADWLEEDARAAASRRLGQVALVFVADLAPPAPPPRAAPPGSFLELSRRSRQQPSLDRLGLIGKASLEEPLTATLNPGEYFSRANRIWLSPEIVAPPYLRGERARADGAGPFHATSFGGLGSVMAHELAHVIPAALPGFADGSVTGNGERSPAAGHAARDALAARLACLKRGGDGGAGTEAIRSDTRRTLGETWADRVGVDVALEAMDDEAIVRGRERPLESWQRDFFVAYAQTLCAFHRDAPPGVESALDAHAPAHSRINKVVADMPEFARAFACGPGRSMAPSRRCSAW